MRKFTPREDRVIGRSGHRRHRKIGKIARKFGDVLLTVQAVLCEIFDESAYERFLVRTHAVRSVGSYREFLQEREMDVTKIPRCC
jgi:hypothetical protein